MKLLAWMPTAFLLLFLRFLPSNAGTVGRNTTAKNNGAIPIDASSGDNMASAFATVSTNLENPSATGLNGSQEEPCGQISEEEPPHLMVYLTKETGAGEGLKEEINLELGMDGEATQVDDVDGILITCSANYPIYFQFGLSDGYFIYSFKKDREYCKCEQEGCYFCFKLGIRFPMKIWNSLEETGLAFTCRSLSGRAVMQKKVVLTRSENSTRHVEILTISTEKLETAMTPPTFNGRGSVRIGNCQLDSYGDDGFLREASGKIPACDDELNVKVWAMPCLTEQRTEINGNAIETRKSSPFLDMDVLERLICWSGESFVHDENTKKSGSNGNSGGIKNHTKTEGASACCEQCKMVLLGCTFLFVIPVCWVIFYNACCCLKDEDDAIRANARMFVVDGAEAEPRARLTSSMHVKWKVYSLTKP